MLPLANKPRIEDTSFSAYLKKAKELEGDTHFARVLAYSSYPGAWIGAQIHNYGRPQENSSRLIITYKV